MPPAVIGIISAIVGAASLGTSIYGMTQRPSAPKAAPVGPTKLQQEQQQTGERAAISQQVPNVLASTSGLVSPEYVAQISKLLSGTAGLPGASGAARGAVGSAFGFPSTFTPAGAGTSGGGTGGGSSSSLSDFADSVFYG